ncbi:hypothetical protein AWV80_01340 [Cupriavidus sp. UYMU48A]|nr:hypothetical protein AWV80_01340 [Cupriavidus sp. UYMU48A]
MTRKHPRNWTDEEVEILRFQWHSGHPVKTWAHLLPNRTERAIRLRGREMGLPLRGNGRTPGNSVTWHAIERVLSDGIARDAAEIGRSPV